MKKFSIKDQAILVNAIPLSGFAEGDDVVQGDRREDAFTDVVGADGNMLVTQNANRSGDMVFRLLKGSASNTYMSALFNLQEKGEFSAVTVSVVDTKSGDTVIGTKGYIKRPAPVSFGSQYQALEWTVTVEDYEAIFGLLPEL